MKRIPFLKLTEGVYPIHTENKPTKMFEDVVCDGGSPALDCELCGRTHFNNTGEYMDEGELEGFVQKLQENPSRYCEHDGQIHHGRIMGMQVVIGCPCNGLRLIEEFFWGGRRIIADYLQVRSEHQLAMSIMNMTLANKIKETVDQEP